MDPVVLIVAAWLVGSWIVGRVALIDGRSSSRAVVLSLLFSPVVALLVVLVVGYAGSRSDEPAPETRTAEERAKLGLTPPPP